MDFVGITLSARGRTILHGVSGRFPAGELTAIMGPSGSGKTSLLETLAFERAQHVQGSVVLHQHGPQAEDRRAAFVHQDNNGLMAQLTVLETLEYTARLMGIARVAAANQLFVMGLSKCAETRIKDVSGGELRRTKIAQAMLARPAYLFLDEPTSGLDSHTAFSVVQALYGIAHPTNSLRPCTVIMVLHSPSVDTLKLCGCLAVMHQGRLVFCGRTPEAFEVLYGKTCPPGKNLAEFMLDCVVETPAQQPPEGHPALQDDVATQAAAARISSFPYTLTQRRASAPRQIGILIHRQLRVTARDPALVAIPALNAFGFGLFLGLVFLGAMQTKTQQAIQTQTGLVFFVCLNQAFAGSKLATDALPTERLVVHRERRLYGPFTFLLSRSLVFWVTTTWMPLAFVGVVMLMSMAPLPCPRLDVVGPMALVTMAGAMAHLFFGFLIGAQSKSAAVAGDLANTLVLVTVLFSGFYAQTGQIPAFLAWIQWVSPLRYMFGGAMSAVFAGAEFTCADAAATGCIATGGMVLTRMGLQDDSWPRSVAVLLGGFVPAYFLLAWAAVTLRPAHN